MKTPPSYPCSPCLIRHLREYLEDLLLEYRVDLVLSGHVHSYYRSCSVQQEVRNGGCEGVL